MQRLNHKCTNGDTFSWIPRVEFPRVCPNCHQRLKHDVDKDSNTDSESGNNGSENNGGEK